MDWTPLAPVIGAVFLGAFKLAAYWLRLRAIMAASPEQLSAINKIETPVFLRSSGPALALLAFGGALAALPLVSSRQAQGRPDCNPTTCKPPARCTPQGCADIARPPSPPSPAAITSKPPSDSSIDGDPAWSGIRTVWDGRVQWLERGS